MNPITRRMFLKWAMVAAASPGALLVEPKLISIPVVPAQPIPRGVYDYHPETITHSHKSK